MFSKDSDYMDYVAYEFLSGFKGRVEQFLRAESMPLQLSKIHRWRSEEAPTWRQWILEVVVLAEATEALKVWDDLGEMLQRETAQNMALRDAVSLSVRWKTPVKNGAVRSEITL